MTIGLLDRANLRPPTDVYRVPQTVVAVRRVLRRAGEGGLDASRGLFPPRDPPPPGENQGTHCRRA